MDTKRLFSIEQASRLLGKDPKTVRRWADSGKVYCERTKGGHRRVDISPYLPEEAIRSADLSFSKRGKKKKSTKNLPVIVVGYCIQLGKKSKGCIDKQEEMILNRYPSAEIIVEDGTATATVGTSIADKEKLWAILDLIVQGNPIHFVVCRTAIMGVEEWAVVKQVIERWGSDSSFEILLG